MLSAYNENHSHVKFIRKDREWEIGSSGVNILLCKVLKFEYCDNKTMSVMISTEDSNK